jgi:predicted  nucleic acid-binding Zn-ribbon protein
MHEEVGQFVDFIKELGPPDFLINCWIEDKSAEEKSADEKKVETAIEKRWKAKNEVEEVPEDMQEEFKKQEADAKVIKTGLEGAYQDMGSRVNIVQLNCSGSLELTVKELSNVFMPKIVLINHEKDLKVDTPCANLSIKYNMLYISVYQAIKEEIKSESDLGKQLQQHKRMRELSISSAQKDEFQES